MENPEQTNRKVAAIQMVSSAKLDENLVSAAHLMAEAKAAGAELILLPEVFAVLEGGPMRPFGEHEGKGPIQEFLAEQARSLGVVLIGGTIPLISRPGKKPDDPDYLVTQDRVRPASLVFDANGAQIARYDKIHLFDVMLADEQASYSESRSYEAGDEVVVVDTEIGRLGLTVCYDLRFPELYRRLFRRQVDLVTVPAAFTKVTGEVHWEPLLRARAIENQCYVIASGQGGRHNEKRETWGHSMIIDPWGTVLDEVEQGEGFAIAEIDLQFLASIRKRMPVLEQCKL